MKRYYLVTFIFISITAITLLAMGRGEELEMRETPLTAGMKAPDFKAPSTEGKEIALKDLKGKIIVLYFYPKDDTPGCTKQACGLRDINQELQDLGVVVLGVSLDSIKSHESFREKYNLNFPLLSDPEGEILMAYGVWKGKGIIGSTAFGVKRSTFIIDGEGIVRQAWYGVNVSSHAEDVLKAVKELKK